MHLETLKEAINGVDIYILDQILKDRYQPGATILDAGCGTGRNLKWFYSGNYNLHGTDLNADALTVCKEKYPLNKDNFIQCSINKIPYKTNSFDHIICNAVLHFAEDLNHFSTMFEELLRILKPNGSLFIRTASNFGIENNVEHIKNGVYNLPDGSTRFLLTTKILNDIKNRQTIEIIEAVKTTIVENKRSMTTLVIQKK